MKMTNFKSLPNVFGIFLGLMLVCLFGVSTGLQAQTSFNLPVLKSKDQIIQIVTAELLVLQEYRKTSCLGQDPTEPCAKRLAALMGAYMDILAYFNDQPQLSPYDVVRNIYPGTNRYNNTVVPEVVNMTGFNNQQYNIYFIEILDRIKV